VTDISFWIHEISATEESDLEPGFYLTFADDPEDEDWIGPFDSHEAAEAEVFKQIEEQMATDVGALFGK
jgi:hypothetical protein